MEEVDYTGVEAMKPPALDFVQTNSSSAAEQAASNPTTYLIAAILIALVVGLVMYAKKKGAS